MSYKEREPILIIYDGPENSGKTTIKRIVNELINHRSLSFERWTGTQYAYARLYGRQVDLRWLLKMDERMDEAFGCVLVYLYASPSLLMKRKNNDPIEGTKYQLNDLEIAEVIRYFDIWYANTPFRVKRRFDTTNESPESIAKQIVEACKTWRPNITTSW